MSMSVKNYGRVYTPEYLVSLMLDFGGYICSATNKKHVIDNSCGDGAFLKEIVKRYIEFFIKENDDVSILKQELETYIHGIEIDKQEFEKCIHSLDTLVAEYGLQDVKWDILNADALEVHRFDRKMDFVFGNPPYVRVHNLLENYSAVKQYRFAEKGMTDLFIVFFEIGFNMLSSHGTMCLITPSSWLSSKAGVNLRKYITEQKNLSGIVDLEHFQAFPATTYSLISRFQTTKEDDEIEYYIFNPNNTRIEFKYQLSQEQITINGDFYFGSTDVLSLLRKIKSTTENKYAVVKNGFATLADKVFIGNFGCSSGCIKVLKASTGKWSKCIFPYDESGSPLSETEFENNSEAYEYLVTHKEFLSSKQKDGNQKWYLFGRSQGLKDVSKEKYAINTIIKDIESIKLNFVPKGQGVFSGLYIITSVSYEFIKQQLLSENFIGYVKSLRKYKSGGYYTFSSKDLEQYLNNKISESYE